MLESEVTIKVGFYDLDPMEVVWHGNYPRFLEDARCALLDRIGYSYTEMRESGFTWPVVDMRIKYMRPIIFEQEIRVTAALVEYENRIRIDYRIHDVSSGELLTRAQTTQVAVGLESGEMHFESPSLLVEKVERLL